ncbi:metallophosphoesterase family protein [Rhizobium sp. BK251]|uniref:metallophosphoesterase family protein n=1 Tax=Rhizobium sp. BK251 TaxID=2512125 RepID=UPI00104C723C|nr:metallophosphoesterase family protein [Rhizobium sp. BK251]TCL69527.1 serine/threonine protein phosphatase 1 [Rhizobium sp. BK251]
MLSLARKILGKTLSSQSRRRARARISYGADEFSAIYAIGDVHGCYGQLIELEQLLLADGASIEGRKLIVMLGDYVDRGARSKDVLEHLRKPLPAGFERVTLCGNHEDAFLDFLTASKPTGGWLELGGQETLYSYGIDATYIMRQGGGIRAVAEAARLAVPQAHVKLLQEMPIVLSIGTVIFVHAGIRPGIPLDKQTDDDMMWIREPFLSEGPGLPVKVVHGHTPGPEPVFGKDRICIDTAAFATGKLTALKVAGGEVWVM